MISSSVARRYVSALHELAGEADAYEQISSDLHAILDLMKREKELETVLVNPSIDPDKKIAVVDEVLGDQVNKLSRNFIRLLIRKARVQHLDVMAAEYDRLERRRTGIVVVDVTTARELDNESLENLRRRFAEQLNAQVEMKTTVDASLIGGMVARIGDTVYDGSVDHQLALMQQRFGEE